METNTPAIHIATLSVHDIEPNPWNPNQMTAKAYERLKQEIVNSGFLEPIQVVPHEGKYRILGGEHRHKAMMELGYTEIPAVILADPKYQGEAGEDACKFLTMRLNCLHGKVSPKKFEAFYNSLVSKHPAEFMQDLLGVVDNDEWEQILSDAKLSAKSAFDNIPDDGLKKSLLDSFDKEASKAKTAEDLEKIVSKLMEQATNTLASGYMVFSYGGQKHIFLEVPKKEFAYIHERLAALQEQGLKPGSVIYDLLVGYIPGEAIAHAQTETE